MKSNITVYNYLKIKRSRFKSHKGFSSREALKAQYGMNHMSPAENKVFGAVGESTQ